MYNLETSAAKATLPKGDVEDRTEDDMSGLFVSAVMERTLDDANGLIETVAQSEKVSKVTKDIDEDGLGNFDELDTVIKKSDSADVAEKKRGGKAKKKQKN